MNTTTWAKEVIAHLDTVDDNSKAGLAFRAAFASGESPECWDTIRTSALDVIDSGNYTLYIWPDNSWIDTTQEGIDMIGNYDTLDDALNRYTV